MSILNSTIPMEIYVNEMADKLPSYIINATHLCILKVTLFHWWRY